MLDMVPGSSDRGLIRSHGDGSFREVLAVEDRTEEGRMSTPENLTWRTRLIENGFPDRSFDVTFWQEQGDEAIFAAAWELVELAEEISHGRKPTLQRTVTTLKRN
jgi:hypothetical protein